VSVATAAPAEAPGGMGTPPHPLHWLARAWRRLGWRQVALAAVVSVLAATFGPNGGAFLFPGPRVSDPFAELLGGRWLCTILPLVFAAMVADEAYEDGVAAVLAYGVALALGAFVAGEIDATIGRWGGWNRSGSWLPNAFRLKQALLQGSLAFAIYAFWRTTRRALRRVQVSEAERLVGRQQLLGARLMALQARVEPQFLFDALSRIGALHEHDAQGADALLTDLIALLRAMLPTGSAATSSVAREFALAGAWLRVQHHMGASIDVQIAASPLAAPSGLAAMLVLPLLQEIGAKPGAASLAWRLSGELVPSVVDLDGSPASARTPRLRLRLAPNVPLPEAVRAAQVTPGVVRLRERLAELYGSAATLSVVLLANDAPAFELDLPIIPEYAADDHRPDR
jgi:hypothetical protein